MKKFMLIAILVTVWLVLVAAAFLNTGQEIRINTGKIEAVELHLVDGVTEFLPGDSILNIRYMTVYGVSGNAYELNPDDAQFEEILDLYY